MSDLKLHLIRTQRGDNSTLGMIYEMTSLLDDEYQCYSLEDEIRVVKVPGETAIPKGTYIILPRTEGGMHPKYAARYPDMHVGMAWLQDVPGFSWVYIHVGNREDQTAGCLLVGTGYNETSVGENNFTISGSRDAYEALYPKIAAAWERGDTVSITITNSPPQRR